MKKAQLFAVIGFLVGWCAPSGALVIRILFQKPAGPLLPFINQEWTTYSFFYWYMLVGTCLVLTVLGWQLGRNEERMEEDFAEREKRARSAFSQ